VVNKWRGWTGVVYTGQRALDHERTCYDLFAIAGKSIRP
jgi:hypothetical protein